MAVVATFGVTAAIVFGFAWWRSRGRIDLEKLSPEDRSALFAEAEHANPGAFIPAVFEPSLVYTLKPNARMTAWDDTFTANELGYRAGSSAKAPGTFRIVFVGDSWTFGMGLSEAQAFPRKLEKIANRLGAQGGRVEAWTLALPGYNPIQEIAALEFFWPRLQPDAVVLGLCSNDMDSAAAVLPEGSLARSQGRGDEFGDDHSRVYRAPLLNAPSFRRRWRRAFAEIRAEEARLTARKTPLFLYFIASWEEVFAHALVAEAGLKSPYLVVPKQLTVGRYRNPPPFRHGTAEANGLYAERLYRAIASELAWPPLDTPEGVPPPRFFRAPAAGDWRIRSEELLVQGALKLPEEYRPGPDREEQCLGPMDCATGLFGRATTLLIRRRAGAERIVVELARLAEAPSLYPQEVEFWIESPAGGTRQKGRLEPRGPEVRSFEIPLPKDLVAGSAIDVAMAVERVVVSPHGLTPRGARVMRVSQVR